MKIILSSRRHHYLIRVGIFLIAVALIAGIVSCIPDDGIETYDLTMAVDPTTGGTAIDETGGSPYEEDATVNVKAIANEGYQFAGWTAPAGTFDDANEAEAAFTMPGQDVTVTAHFEAIPLDHFKFYRLDEATAPFIGKVVQLEDQFGTINATVMEAVVFGNPVEKVHDNIVTPISHEDYHLTYYNLVYDKVPQSWEVALSNQFGTQNLTVRGPVALVVPTQKEGHEVPADLDHFLLYEVTNEPSSLDITVNLNDQFKEETVVVYEPIYFANPVQKTLNSEVTEIQNPDNHLVFYTIEGEPFYKMTQTVDQFGEWTLYLDDPELLALPSQKLAWEQPFDHFTFYGGYGSGAEGDLYLEDQFGALEATLGDGPSFFGFPTKKEHDGIKTAIYHPDDHFAFYHLDYERTPPVWQVVVKNQFGDYQELTVTGPTLLGVPAQREGYDQPLNLDHILLYEVIDSTNTPAQVEVFVECQFWYCEGEATFYEPIYFANPVQKTFNSEVTEIQNPEQHLVFYTFHATGYLDPCKGIEFSDQFGEHSCCVDQMVFFGVPSEKIEWSLVG